MVNKIRAKTPINLKTFAFYQISEAFSRFRGSYYPPSHTGTPLSLGKDKPWKKEIRPLSDDKRN